MKDRDPLVVGPSRILLVEDDHGLAKALGRLMGSFGCVVVHAGTISDARARLGEGVFDLAVLDIDLPDGNGMDIVMHLRRLEDPCAAVILTGSVSTGHLREAVGLGVTEYLRKPIGVADLSAAVGRGVEQTRHMREWSAGLTDTGVREVERSSTGVVRQVTAEFGLTGRESEVLDLVAEGRLDREIANALGVSYSRVRQVIAKAFAKMGLRGRNDFIRFLCERILI